MQGLNDFERSVFDTLIAGDHPALASLRRQSEKVCLVPGFIPRVAGWRPVLSPTARAVRRAHWALWLSASLLLAQFLLGGLANRTGHHALASTALDGALATLWLTWGVYIAVHWAYRPEAVLPAWIVRAADPIGESTALIVAAVRRRRRAARRQHRRS